MALNSQNLTASGMGKLAEDQMKQRVLDQAVANPNQLQTGGQLGATPTNGAIAPTPINYQAIYNTDQNKAVSDAVGSEQSQGSLTSAPANSYVSSLGKNISTRQAQLQADAAASEEKLAGLDKMLTQQGSNLIQNQLKAAETAQKPIKEQFADVRGEITSARTEAEATQKVADFRSEQAGTPYAVSAKAKREQQYALEDKRLNQKETEALNAAWDNALRGEIAISQKLLGEAATAMQERQRIRDDARAEQESIAKLQEYEDNRALKAQDRAMNTVENIVKAGFTLDQVPASYLDELDTQSGNFKGFSKGLFEVAQSEREAASIQNEEELKSKKLANATKLIDTLNKIPVGQSINIDGIEYTGLDRGDIKTGTETDANGNVTFYSFDQNTGKVTTTSLGSIGKAVDGWETKFDDNGNPWRINAKTGQMTPFSPSVAQQEWQEKVPDGSVSPFTDTDGNPRVQCGAFANDMTGIGVGDSFESKMEKMNIWQKGQGDPKSIVDNIQVGDCFTQKLGTWTGHIGMVLGVDMGPNGEPGIRALESNYPQKGKITSSRFIPLSQIDGIGRGSKLNSALQSGPDAPSGPTFGGKKKDDKVLSPDEIKKYGLDPTNPDNIGLTLTEARLKRAAELQNQPISPDKLSFEDFAAKRTAELQGGGVAGPVDPKQLKTEFEEHKTFISSVKDSINAVKRGRFSSISEKQEFVDQANALMKDEDYDGLENLVNQVGRKSMSADQQNKYDSSLNLIDTYQSGMEMLSSFAQDKNFKTGNIKRIIENAKKAGSFDRDTRYAQLEQLLGSAQNEYRNALFGASLTPGELAEANKVIIDSGSDTPATMWTKMEQGKKIQQFVSDVRLANALGLKRPKLNEYIKY